MKQRAGEGWLDDAKRVHAAATISAVGGEHRALAIANPKIQAFPTPRARFQPVDGTDGYVEAAPKCLLRALEHAFGELDALPSRPTPDYICDGTLLRRRLLELRLLMDFNAFAYDPDLLKVFRGVLDRAYESLGVYKDLHVAELLLREELCPRLVDRRLLDMSVALAPLHSSDVREALARFLSAASAPLRELARKQVPQVWSLAETCPTDELDAAGNLAHLGHNLLRNLRTQGLPVADIFDPEQDERVHDIRKAARSILILNDLFPATRHGTADLCAPLVKLVSTCGEVHDRVIASHAAQRIGRGADGRAEELKVACTEARAELRSVLDGGSFDLLIERLALIEKKHRRARCAEATMSRAA
jgi:CHAD domain-containing protein